MNVQKIFDVLKEDDKNSALGIICSELEKQGYTVKIDGKPVTGGEVFNGKFQEVENSMNPLKISLFKSGSLEQEFVIEFTDYHEFIIKQK